MINIVQDLCKRPGLNKTGFGLSPICIPGPEKFWISPSFSDNIGIVFEHINLAIHQKMQNTYTLKNLEKDCALTVKLIDKQIQDEENNNRRLRKGIFNLQTMWSAFNI